MVMQGQRVEAMRIYGQAALSEFLGDRVVYRNLKPADPELTGIDQLRPQIGLPARYIPRKNEVDYGRVIVDFLRQARRQDDPSGEVDRLIYVGDTRLLDTTAFSNMCLAGGWPGLAFICAENSQPLAVELESVGKDQTLYLANRWSALQDFDQFCMTQALPPVEGTAVVVDLDKTVLGARGRNDHVIDQVRLQAVEGTVEELLGEGFDLAEFQCAYYPLNQPEFHHFTADNQDYLAYICLILGSGLFTFKKLIEEIHAGRMATFRQFINSVEERKVELPGRLATIHHEIYLNFQSGDPTPFKAFRRNEYLSTIRRFGTFDQTTPIEQLLAEEILITQEVREIAQEWHRRGATLFGLSDKPDEASTPTLELARQGYQPIHRALTHSVGE
jgi:hypothetical protein